MNKVYIVKYSDLGMDGIVCAFTTEEEAKRYELALEMEKEDIQHLHFYSVEVSVYGSCEEIENG